jgi:UPF0755 protein
MLLNKKRIVLWVYVLVACCLVRGIFFIQHINAPLQFTAQLDEQLENEYRVEVEAGSTFNRIVSRLAADGLIEYPFDVRLYGRLSGKANTIKAGDYHLTEGMSAVDLLDKMIAGEVIIYQVILVEGWTLLQALQAIQNHAMVTSTIVAEDQSDIKSVLQSLLQSEFYPEGLIFPDTYNFSRGTTDRELLERAAENMQAVLAQEWSGRDVGLPYSNPYDALIMASIIEKETGLASEREQIAGVFIRRLNQGMRLQTDPTVIYGMGESYDGDLTRTDLRTATPYNTYTNSGLPPTPIALPGREAIAASLHPDQSDTLYFVARGDGSHYFSTTLQEHEQAVQQYQLSNTQ